MPDSVPERSAAQTEAVHIPLEDIPVEQHRWGIEEAKERKQQARAAKENSNRAVIPKPTALPDGGVDGLLAKPTI